MQHGAAAEHHWQCPSVPRYLPRGINRRPAVDFRDALAQFELADWQPPEDGATFAAVRAAPHEHGGLVRHCPTIDPRWTSGLAAFRGQLAELLVYDRTLTQDEADCVEQYLAHRYSETADPRWFDNGSSGRPDPVGRACRRGPARSQRAAGRRSHRRRRGVTR